MSKGRRVLLEKRLLASRIHAEIALNRRGVVGQVGVHRGDVVQAEILLNDVIAARERLHGGAEGAVDRVVRAHQHDVRAGLA